MRLLGIDYGTKRIGVAVSDEAGSFAFPHSVIENNKKAIGKIKKICSEKNIEKIVLGESVDYKGQSNPIMDKIEKFKNELEKETSLPVIYQKEILTTWEAGRGGAREENIKALSSKGQRRAVSAKIKKDDASAAALILRSYLENH